MPENNELSEREREILHLVATGASNKEIANALYISTNTVKVHLRNIFSKIGAASRTEAAMYAVSIGLMEPNIEANNDSQKTNSILINENNESHIESASDLQEKKRRNSWPFIAGSLLLIILLYLVVIFLRSVTTPEESTTTTFIENEIPRWEKKAPLPTARHSLMVAAYGDYIYAISGETASGITDIVERYDPGVDEWVSLIGKPIPVKDASAAVIGGKIYVPGGELENGSMTNVLEIFDPIEEKWESGKALPIPVSGYALASFEGKLYLFGGWDGARYLSSVYEYNPDENVWTQRTSMPTARAFAGAAVSGNKIYVIGGYDGKHALAINEIYQPYLDDNQNQSWEAGSPLPIARYGMGVASLADIVHVIGGMGNRNIALNSLVYSPEIGSWQTVNTDEPVGSKLGLAPLGEFIYVVGGMINNSPVDNNIAYRAIYSVALPVIIR